MNIGFVVSSISRNAGGIFVSVRSLAKPLALQLKTRISIFGLRDNYTARDLAVWKPLQPIVLKTTGPRSLGFAPQLSRSLVAGGVDLLHTQGIWQAPSFAVNRWGRITGKSYLISPRGMLDPWALANSRWKKAIAACLYENRHLQGAACLHALCESEAVSMREYGLRNPICIIPNGIDLPQHGNGKVESGNAPWNEFVEPGKKVLLFLSRIHPKKGLINLIMAWGKICKADSKKWKAGEWVLAIAGWDQGGHEAELKRLCDELELKWADIRLSTQDSKLKTQNCDILFLGPQFSDDKTACYAACDAFVLPSFSEGLPMVVLEAWSHGKPALITPECNLSEGFSTDSAIRIEANAKSVEEGLRMLFLMSDAERNAMGQRGLTLVSERFTWPKIAAEMKAVYEWVLGGGAKPASVID